MRILVLGGTVFVSRAIAEAALAAGHEVTVTSRGRSGPPPDGARHVVLDREEELPESLVAERFDAVVDVARTPSWVRRAVSAWPSAHWVFVSTVSVYADDTTPGGGAGITSLHPAQHDDVDLAAHPEAYGPMKVACEEVVLAGAERALVLRPGLIVGPGDPTGRFTYWPLRLAEAVDGEPVLVGGRREDAVQVIDARDLAAWIVHCLATGATGMLDAVGPVMGLGELLDEVARGVGRDADRVPWRWVGDDDLAARGVAPWSGPRSLPLWLPRPAYDGMLARDPEPARRAGLQVRAIARTAADVRDWAIATGAVPTGLTRAEEAEALAALG